ncbi:HEAT repeat domain-containing protein [Sorangium sp. So ce1024]|uniref:HEAT repeat domain-containing protein n=1 Tax=unclassified Sorangium TaxID=2621164 RepID=UPI003F02387D
MQEVADASAALETVLAGLKSPEPRERRLSARRFGALPLSDPFGTLSPLLDDSDPDVRLAALDALEDVLDERASVILLHMAANDSSQDVREASLQELKKYRSEQIFRFLLSEVSRPQRSRRPRQIIAEQLKNYDSEESVDALLKLTQDADVYVQERAIESLFHLNRPRLRDFWRSTMLNWKGTHWGELARNALRNLQSAKKATDRPRRRVATEPTIAEHKVKHQRINSRPRPHSQHLTNEARRPADNRTPPDTRNQLDKKLHYITQRFALDLWPLLYRDALYDARQKLSKSI